MTVEPETTADTYWELDIDRDIWKPPPPEPGATNGRHRDAPAWDMPGETAPGGKPRFVLLPFNSLVAPLAPYYLVKGILPARGLVVIWGPPKCGKSFWTFDLAMHIALGWPYRGRKVRQGPVVYIACEGGDYFGARVEAFRQTRMADDLGFEVPFHLIKGSLDLIREHKRLALEIAAACPNPAAVIIDTVNTSLDGSEIDDMPAYSKAAIFVAQTLQCVVPVVHHCGVAGERPRGHSSLTGNCDAQIAVSKSLGGLVTAKIEAMKDGEDGTEIRSRLQVVEVGTDTDGDPITSCVIDPAEAEASAPQHDKLRPNLRTALGILREALPEGLTLDAWYDAMRDEGIGQKRRQDLGDIRRDLLRATLIHEYNGRFYPIK